MRKSQYTQLRKALEAGLLESKATTASIQRRIDALDVVWHEILCKEDADQPAAAPATQSDEVAEPTEVDLGNLQQDIGLGPGRAIPTGDIVEDFASGPARVDPFGVRDIEELIRGAAPALQINRTTISGRLKKMADDGILEIVERPRDWNSPQYLPEKAKGGV